MKEITVAVIGSGSTYCPELVDGFIKAQSSLKLKKISFMDIDERKRTIVGNLCLRMLKKAGIECETLLTDNLDEALQGADFVVTQIRVGMLHARYLDETIPLKYDLIGQETTGIGGFFMHARGGLQTEYMGKEWFENVGACIDEAKKKGMHAWAYDENGWPSGFGGGKVNGKGEKFQQKYLRIKTFTPD